MPTLKKIAKGDAFNVDQINQLIDELNRLNKISTGGGISYSNNSSGLKFWLKDDPDVLLGVIVASGDCTAPDGSPSTAVTLTALAKYYVETAYVSNDETDACSALLKVTKYPNTDSRWRSVLATNISEHDLGSHNTPVGTWVLLRRQYDNGSPPTERFFFEHTEESVGQYLGMVKQVVAQGQVGYDFVFASADLT